MMLSSALTAPLSGPEQPTPSFALGSRLRSIQDSGRVRVAVRADSPLAHKDSQTGTFGGFEVTLAKLLAPAIFGGTVAGAVSNIEFIEISSQEREFVCGEDRADMVISEFGVTEQRKKLVDFTDPYFGTHFGILTRQQDVDPDISTATIAVVEGTTCVDFVRDNDLGSKMITVEHGEGLIEALRSGVADIVLDGAVTLDMRARENREEFNRVKRMLHFDSWSVGVDKGNDELLQLLNRKIQTEFVNGSIIAAATQTSA